MPFAYTTAEPIKHKTMSIDYLAMIFVGIFVTYILIIVFTPNKKSN